MKEIQLNKLNRWIDGLAGNSDSYSSYITQVDDDDVDWLNLWNWTLSPVGYAYRKKHWTENGKHLASNILLHRELMNCSDDNDVVVSHIDGNKLNNQKSNLLICTRVQHAKNVGTKNKKTSTFRGVSRSGTRYRATITINKVLTNIGLYATEIEAAQAYDRWVIENLGKSGRLNFPVER